MNKFEDLLHIAKAISDNALIEEDVNGELIICTGYRRDGDSLVGINE